MNQYVVKTILESDYGCEERLEGDPKIDKVLLVSELGEEIWVEVEDDFLYKNSIEEGTVQFVEGDVDQLFQGGRWNHLA